MKKNWQIPELRNLTAKDTYAGDGQVICKNSICISKCEGCGGCIASSTKLQQCSYYKNSTIKICTNAENGGCKLPDS